MSWDVNYEYFDWLVDLIRGYPENDELYSCLLWELYNIDFYATVPGDENRVQEGLDLREQYDEEKGYSTFALCYINGELVSATAMEKNCSFLEMLIALAEQCEQIMHDPDYGDRTSFWFWTFLDNAGLMNFWNDVFMGENVEMVHEITKNITIHQKSGEFKKNGEGFGELFPLKNSKKDMTKAEIWYQMNAWLIENY